MTLPPRDAILRAMARLIVTNGDVAADLLVAADVDADVLPWRDVLHEGPIVGGGLAESSAVRSAFLAGRFGIEPGEIAAEFAGRDAVLRGHAAYDTVELWFEHDLYDQLQLLQVLAFLADEGRTEGVRLVQADDYLGTETAATILRFATRARALGEEEIDFADLLFADLAMPTPEAAAARIRDAPADGLPFVVPALRRFLGELPGIGNGLSRSEATALSLLTEAPRTAIDLFRRTTVAETAAFMGDMSFFLMLHDLAECPTPLIAGLDPRDEGDAGRYARPLSLTAAGRAVVAGADDHVRRNGIDRWWAGTRLKGRATWRYDRDTMRLAPPQAGAA